MPVFHRLGHRRENLISPSLGPQLSLQNDGKGVRSGKKQTAAFFSSGWVGIEGGGGWVSHGDLGEYLQFQDLVWHCKESKSRQCWTYGSPYWQQNSSPSKKESGWTAGWCKLNSDSLLLIVLRSKEKHIIWIRCGSNKRCQEKEYKRNKATAGIKKGNVRSMQLGRVLVRAKATVYK